MSARIPLGDGAFDRVFESFRPEREKPSCQKSKQCQPEKKEEIHDNYKSEDSPVLFARVAKHSTGNPQCQIDAEQNQDNDRKSDLSIRPHGLYVFTATPALTDENSRVVA